MIFSEKVAVFDLMSFGGKITSGVITILMSPRPLSHSDYSATGPQQCKLPNTKMNIFSYHLVAGTPSDEWVYRHATLNGPTQDAE